MNASTCLRAARKAAEVADHALSAGGADSTEVFVRKLQQSERLFDYALKLAERQEATLKHMATIKEVA